MQKELPCLFMSILAFINYSLVLKETISNLSLPTRSHSIYFNAKISKTKSHSFPKSLLLQGPQTISWLNY